TIIKAGVALARDLTELQKLFPFTPANVVDLGDIAKRRGMEQTGLRIWRGCSSAGASPKGRKRRTGRAPISPRTNSATQRPTRGHAVNCTCASRASGCSRTTCIRLLDEPLRFEPEETILRPRMTARQPHAMLSVLVDVQVKRHARFSQRRGKQQAVLDRHRGILVRGPDKARRSLGCHL